MTNFEAINAFRKMTTECGALVPELAAHLFAGVTRVRWNEIRRSVVSGVPVRLHLGVEYVPLTWLEARNTQRGYTRQLRAQRQVERTKGLSSPNGLVHPRSSEHSKRKPFHNQNLSNIPAIRKSKRRKTHAVRINSGAIKTKGK